MTLSPLLKAVESGDFGGFEARCLEMIEASTVNLRELAPAFELLQKKGEGRRAETVGQMVLDAAGNHADARDSLVFVAALLNACPENADFRKTATSLFRRAYADTPGFEDILKNSGLEGARPARVALRVLDLCLSLKPGAHLINRMDETPVEVTHVDPAGALFTLKSGGRTVTVNAAELASKYEVVKSDDIRVLRKLQPQRLVEMAVSDPVKLVVSILHAHGEAMDVDVLKHDLVPSVIGHADWTGWWNKTRAQLKRSPNVIIEGRSPVFLKYTNQDVTLEDETWDGIIAAAEPVKWQSLIESYVREKKKHKEPPDADFLKRVVKHIADHIVAVRPRRPEEAFACALVAHRLSEQDLPFDAAAKAMAGEVLKSVSDPVKLIARLDQPALWERAIEILPAARPEDWRTHMAALLPFAPEMTLNQIVKASLDAEKSADVQTHLDAAFADPLNYADIISWLWKGPKGLNGVALPSTRELLARIMSTLSSLGRTVNPSIDVMKNFRAKMKTALAHRDYARFRDGLEQIDAATAVTVRRQIDRVEGLGDNAPTDMMRILRETHPQMWVTKRIEPWDDPNVLFTTQEGFQRKKAEIEDLINVKMRENAKAIGRAAEYGDLSENSEYKFALEERDLLRARLAHLNDEMSKAQVFQSGDVPTDTVGIGSSVVLVDVQDGAERALTFFGPWDADIDRNIYNYMAPVGLKLMGARVGDRVTLTIDGTDRHYDVRSVSNGFEVIDRPAHQKTAQ